MVMVFFVLHSFLMLFLFPGLESFLFSDRGGFSAVMLCVEVEVQTVDKVVFLHVYALRVRGLFPFLAYSPALAWAAEPDALVVFFGRQ